VRRWGLLYHQVLRADELSSSRLSLAAHALLWIAVIGGMAAGSVISFGLHGVPIVGKAAELTPLAAKESGIGLGLLPAVALVLVACALL